MGIKYSGDSSLYYAGTDVAINKMNIRNLEELSSIEEALLEGAYSYFSEKLSESVIFDEKYLKNLHKKTFDILYSWAGEYRNINISKRTSLFCPAQQLQSYSQNIFDQLNAENYLKDFSEKPTEEFAQRLAYYMCELIVLHPFYELNGRSIRLFFDMIAIFNGYLPIDYGEIHELEDNEFIMASIACMKGICTPMVSIIFQGLKKVT